MENIMMTAYKTCCPQDIAGLHSQEKSSGNVFILGYNTPPQDVAEDILSNVCELIKDKGAGFTKVMPERKCGMYLGISCIYR